MSAELGVEQTPSFAFAAPAYHFSPRARTAACRRRSRCTLTALSAVLSSHPPQPEPPAPANPVTPASFARPSPDAITDGPFARLCISLMRLAMSHRSGHRSPLPGYAGLVAECRHQLLTRPAREQVSEAEGMMLSTLLRPLVVSLYRENWASQPALNAAHAPKLFAWLVGPCASNTPPEGGSGVLIEKCRFLAEAGCKGMCVNMCQQPVQNVFTGVLGMPLRMTPDYETGGCQMTFGVPPLPVADDPAAKGNCFADCESAKRLRRLHTADKCYLDSLPVTPGGGM